MAQSAMGIYDYGKFIVMLFEGYSMVSTFPSFHNHVFGYFYCKVIYFNAIFPLFNIFQC